MADAKHHMAFAAALLKSLAPSGAEADFTFAKLREQELAKTQELYSHMEEVGLHAKQHIIRN